MRRLARALRAHRRVAAVLAAGSLALAVPGLREVGLGALVAVLLLSAPPRRRRGLPEAAERGTESELACLPAADWVVARSGSFEHLLVGPSGAYLVETKRFAGETMLREGVLGVRREDTWRMDESLAGRLRGSARDARRVLGTANINWVAPVVVLWCLGLRQGREPGCVSCPDRVRRQIG